MSSVRQTFDLIIPAFPTGLAIAQALLLPGLAADDYVRIKSLTMTSGQPQSALTVSPFSPIPYMAIVLQDTETTTPQSVASNNHVADIALQVQSAYFNSGGGSANYQVEAHKSIIIPTGNLPARAGKLKYWTQSATISLGAVLLTITYDKVSLSDIDKATLARIRGSI